MTRHMLVDIGAEMAGIFMPAGSAAVKLLSQFVPSGNA